MEGNGARRCSKRGSVQGWWGGGKRQVRQVLSERLERDCRGPLALLSGLETEVLKLGKPSPYLHSDDPAYFSGPAPFFLSRGGP